MTLVVTMTMIGAGGGDCDEDYQDAVECDEHNEDPVNKLKLTTATTRTITINKTAKGNDFSDDDGLYGDDDDK